MDNSPRSICRLAVGAATDVGRVRLRNEDAIHAEAPESTAIASLGWLGIVADGLGGRPAGQIASSLAVDAIVEVFYRPELPDPQERLLLAVEHANAAIYERSRTCTDESGMATTVTAVALCESRLVVAHVGDTRAYLLRRGELRRLTRDHTLVSEFVRTGSLSPDLALSHPQRHVVTRALGTADRVEVDLLELRAHAGDVVMLCSDGLHGAVIDAEIRDQLSVPPEIAARALVARANDAGGPDNVSVVVVGLGLHPEVPGGRSSRLGRAVERLLELLVLPRF